MGLLATAFFHPTGEQLRGPPDEIERELLLNVGVHALALVSLGLSWIGLVGLSQRLGKERVEVLGAHVAYAMAVMGGICAASVSGFVVTGLVRDMAAADEPTQHALRFLFRYSRFLNGAFANVHVVASCVAILLWSVAMFRARFDTALAVAGIGVGLVGVVGVFSGTLTMNVHGLMLVVLGQGAWMVWAAVLLIRRPA
jgi:hypothetical protein